jgi:hypothetical protein
LNDSFRINAIDSHGIKWRAPLLYGIENDEAKGHYEGRQRHANRIVPLIHLEISPSKQNIERTLIVDSTTLLCALDGEFDKRLTSKMVFNERKHDVDKTIILLIQLPFLPNPPSNATHPVTLLFKRHPQMATSNFVRPVANPHRFRVEHGPPISRTEWLETLEVFH